jgi:hypothetical protein
VVASAKRKKGGRKSFVYKKESFGKKGNVVFYASLRTKRREGVFSPSAQKKKENFVHIKALLIHQWKDKDILQASASSSYMNKVVVSQNRA